MRDICVSGGCVECGKPVVGTRFDCFECRRVVREEENRQMAIAKSPPAIINRVLTAIGTPQSVSDDEAELAAKRIEQGVEPLLVLIQSVLWVHCAQLRSTELDGSGLRKSGEVFSKVLHALLCNHLDDIRVLKGGDAP